MISNGVMTMTSSEDRREVAAGLRKTRGIMAFVDALGIDFDSDDWCWTDVSRRVADLIDPTCVYEPTETLTRWDENDHEHETNEPDFDCATFACSRCGYEMLYGDEVGWFDTEPPYTPHFKFCPNCSARVLPLKLYDKVVSDDD